MIKDLPREKSDIVSIIDENGNLREGAEVDLPKENLIEIYKWLKLVREFDRKAIKLQRQGRIGVYASLEGQEAAQVGSAYALEKEDMMFPTYRDHGAYFVHGMPLICKFRFLKGLDGLIAPEGVNVFPITVPIATHIPHAVGYSFSITRKKQNRIAIAYFGDGATSEGDFHEGLNIAGIFKSPAIFFCQNNQYAISVPLQKQTASRSISEKAKAYGIEGIQVDGNDVLAVYNVVKYAREKAITGKGPTLIEALTYRVNSHTTADDHTRYRSQEEVSNWKKRDPIRRYELLLERLHLIDEKKKREIEDSILEIISCAVEELKGMEPPDPLEMFSHCYQEKTSDIRKQAEYLLELLGDE
ncbi:pyruvate dehydrogenase (acetyl-transferring) E1 component subunit alpha [Thermoflavimicrobium dichotomicum]|uniref:Pyruvate dehydrogenase E1 component subunit alpha n=1 Tax=Thermoflavimicrobium dichotomicum TaxID=46223 RepID=A0A1I3TJZ8_9BACL|nr:pyruvate dehydrogenase (acetyl-transferring) E1 component subunit alpha [Thermoflavimicrobium dichotomicum]SFJ69951.1 pyruvate dehydrogenase E1 component alpha subunit [Thermoflavimicrobium dichotomicum]